MHRIDDLLREAKEAQASDIHISPYRPPFFRVHGQLKKVVKEELSLKDSDALIDGLIGDNIRIKEFLGQYQQADFSYSLPDRTRFRVNVFFAEGAKSAALRLIPSKIMGVEELHLPSHILQFAELKQGFVLAAGPAGHGKTTTLAALVNHINQNREEHIITIEDPIEYQFDDVKSIIDQREIGKDSLSFKEAIRATLRQDPNVILIGELRDLDSMRTALTLAETGHLVLSTLHTNNASETVERIIDSFPTGQQSQIRSQLASVLSGVVSQRLLPFKQGGRIPAIEIMIANTAVKNVIREGEVHQLPGIIQTNSQIGMQTLDTSLQALIDNDAVTAEDAMPYFSTDRKTGKQ